MSCIYSFVIFISFVLLQVTHCEEEQGLIENIVTKGVAATNETTNKFHSGFESLVDVVFKPLEAIGVKAEESIVSGTENFGKLLGLIAKQVKNVASKFQYGEEKFVGCVKSEQFDPVKEIFLDISTCVTSKADTVNKVVQNSLIQVNTTYSILKSLSILPTCENSKCLADYTSGIVGKIGSIALGLATIGKDLSTGIAAIPVTLPSCLVMQPTMSPVKVFGLLGGSILKCFKAE